MGRKIFVSYKYGDKDVAPLQPRFPLATVRNYVDELERLFGAADHIYKGEHDNEDLSGLSEETIRRKLSDRIYDSSLTIVLVSPCMKINFRPEKEQWIPWEIEYSLRETSRHDSSGNAVISRTNAMLAVVLPDFCGSYRYYFEPKECCLRSCVTNHTESLFRIIRENMFNRKDGDVRTCSSGETDWSGSHSYIAAVKWSEFIRNPEMHIAEAYERREHIDSYRICKCI